MTEEELLGLLKSEVSSAVGYQSGRLAEERRRAIAYYRGEKEGVLAPREGLSSFVSRDVADTVESIMPALMRIFTSAEELGRFEPQNPDDEAGARQASDYANYVFFRQNDGWRVLYEACKDALLLKNGYVKVWFAEDFEPKEESFRGLTDDELALLLSDENVEPISHTMEGGAHTITLRRLEGRARLYVAALPPEEVLVQAEAPANLEACRFYAHRREVTYGELRAMGFEADYEELEKEEGEPLERRERYQEEEATEDIALDPANRKVILTEAFRRVDFDGDGIAERRRIVYSGSKIFVNEPDPSAEIIAFTAILNPHKHYGVAPAELVQDLQEIKSELTRQILDNLYLTNRPRMAALEGVVNIDDLLDVRAGKVIRTKALSALSPVTVPFFGAPAFDMLTYLDTVKEDRAGVSRFSQGLAPDVLQRAAAGAVDQVMAKADQRLELYARTLAETGIKSLFWAILRLAHKFDAKPQIIRLSGRYVTVDPRAWSNRYDFVVTVGLGAGSQMAKLAGAQFLLSTMREVVAMGGLGRVLTEQNLYNALIEATKTVYPKNAQQFWTDPQTLPPPTPAPDPQLLKIQVEREKTLLSHKTREERNALVARNQAQELQLELEEKRVKLALEAERQKLERERAEFEAWKEAQALEIERARLALETGREEFARAKEAAPVDTAQAARQQAEAMEAIAATQAALVAELKAFVQELSRPKTLVRSRDGVTIQ